MGGRQADLVEFTVSHPSLACLCEICVSSGEFEGYVHRCRLLPDIPQLPFAPIFDARLDISRLMTIFLVGATYGFYRSNALTHQPIYSRHGGCPWSGF